MSNIFTYGSLMSEKTMGNIAKGKYQAVKATLHGYTRRKVKNFVYPGIKQDKSGLIIGVLWLNVNDDDVKRLDYYQGQGYLYIKTNVQVEVNGVKTQSLVYVFNDTSIMTEEQWNPVQYDVKPIISLD